MLRRQIPVVVNRWKDQDRPGFVEVDTVSHGGASTAGTFIWTVSLVDLSCGWSERAAVMGNSQEAVTDGLDWIRDQLPFPLLGIHPDNGSEFLNWHLWRYCQAREIQFSRGRPRYSNDNPHVEERNWTLVRRLIGYDRLDTAPQMAWLNALYQILRLYANCFQPVMKQRCIARAHRFLGVIP